MTPGYGDFLGEKYLQNPLESYMVKPLILPVHKYSAV